LNKARLSIEVKDNGVGFDPESRPGPDNGHYGLLGIEERVHRLGGMVHIESTIGAGTRVRIENLDSDI
jgi:signal transduction histidine kinase